jgi:hypothetical protein
VLPVYYCAILYLFYKLGYLIYKLGCLIYGLGRLLKPVYKLGNATSSVYVLLRFPDRDVGLTANMAGRRCVFTFSNHIITPWAIPENVHVFSRISLYIFFYINYEMLTPPCPIPFLNLSINSCNKF